MTAEPARPTPPPRLLAEKIWDLHVVRPLGGGYDLLYVDRLFLYEVHAEAGFAPLEAAGLGVRRPDLAFATLDHLVSTAPGRGADTLPDRARYVHGIRARAREHGFALFDLDDPRQGIVHVVAPEQGLALPGALALCGDSHTCTLGGVGALAWGIGSTEVAHVLATQTIVKRRPRTLRVRCEGRLPAGVHAKDLILHLVGALGAAGGDGCAVEYAGPAVEALGVEGRLTLCNLSIELGARIGLVAPDDTTFEYLAGRPFAPRGELWERAIAHWRTLPSDPEAVAEREVGVDAGALAPQITWGTSPAEVGPIDAPVPEPDRVPDADRRERARRALAYMGVEPGRPLEGLPVDVVFIGSCTNSRLDDLRAAAAIAHGRRVAPGVRALVVPGSGLVRRAAEAEGLDRVFTAAGFEWRLPGCSMCVAMNDDVVAPGRRAVSTSNRNFENRQGPGARTHLASPATAAAAAVTGRITDPRRLEARR